MKAFVVFISIFIWATVGLAGVVFEQPHDGSGSIRQSSRYLPNGTDYDQYIWDSFSVTSAQAITEIRWRGGYEPDKTYWGGDVVNFKVSIYASTPGLAQPFLGAQYPGNPATLVSYDCGDKAGETSAGIFNGVELFDYHFVLPTVFQAAAGTLYWIQIEAEEQNGIPDWGFASGSGNGSYFRRIAGQADYYFQYYPADAAFSLLASDGPTFDIAANVQPPEGGAVTGTGLYPDGSTAPMTAIPASGYAFVNWTENGDPVSTTPHYTFAVTTNRTLTANFTSGFHISTESAPAVGGQTTGDGDFAAGSDVTVEAQASGNYLFENWTEENVVVDTNALYTFPAVSDRHLVANFKAASSNLGVVFSQPHNGSGTLILTAYQYPDGNVDGMHYAFEQFSVATTQKISDIRWRGGFAGGTEAANPVVEFVIKIYGSTANGFYPDLANPELKKYTIPGNASQTPAGTWGGVQMYDYHVTLPTSFTAAPMSITSYWVQIEASQTNLPLTWSIAAGAGGNGAHYARIGNNYYSQSGDLAVTFRSAVSDTYVINTSASPTNQGLAFGTGTYASDANVKAIAVANPGYGFVNWLDDGIIASTNTTYSFPATADRNLVAAFARTYVVTLTPSSSAGGTVTGGGTFIVGSVQQARATPKPGYIFANWTEGGIAVSSSTNFLFSVTTNRTFVANFLRAFAITATANPTNGGTVGGAGLLATGTVAQLVATPSAGYHFVNWTTGAVEFSSSPSYSFVVTTSRNFSANFALTIPDLAAAEASPGSMVLAWPGDLPGWLLEETGDLTSGAWLSVTDNIVEANGIFQGTVQPSEEMHFYRLSHP